MNFATKRHWKGKSRIEDIDAGLSNLVAVIRRESIRSIAIPPLGCGNGGLNWNEVRPRIVQALAELPDVQSPLFGTFFAVGSEEARQVALALASVRLSNCTCSFPAYSFHEDSRFRNAIEGIN